MKTGEDVLEKPTYWQLVFSQSKVNGAPYRGDHLDGSNWSWPDDTFLRRRLRQVRFDQTSDKDMMN
jgi:hypothetical protein